MDADTSVLCDVKKKPCSDHSETDMPTKYTARNDTKKQTNTNLSVVFSAFVLTTDQKQTTRKEELEDFVEVKNKSRL